MTQDIPDNSKISEQLFPLCYFPPVQWFTAWQKADNPVAEAWAWYQKQQLTSRTWIKGSENPIALHIPVERRSKKAPIIEKKVSFQEKWTQTHWRSLQNFYRNSPYFTFYEDLLAEYYSQEHPYLIDWLKASIELSFDCLGIQQSLPLTTSYKLLEGQQTDYREDFPGKMGISSNFSAVPYTQVYGEFIPGLSILDLIFSSGPESILIINRGQLLK